MKRSKYEHDTTVKTVSRIMGRKYWTQFRRRFTTYEPSPFFKSLREAWYVKMINNDHASTVVVTREKLTTTQMLEYIRDIRNPCIWHTIQSQETLSFDITKKGKEDYLRWQNIFNDITGELKAQWSTPVCENERKYYESNPQ